MRDALDCSVLTYVAIHMMWSIRAPLALVLGGACAFYCYCSALSHEDGAAQGGGLLSVDGNNNGETNEVTERGGQKEGEPGEIWDVKCAECIHYREKMCSFYSSITE